MRQNDIQDFKMQYLWPIFPVKERFERA